MKLLLDEMFAGLKEYLEVLGWEAYTVQGAGLKGSRDKNIVEYASKQDLVLITEDQKSAELAELKGVKYVYVSSASIAKIIDSEIKRKYFK